MVSKICNVFFSSPLTQVRVFLKWKFAIAADYRFGKLKHSLRRSLFFFLLFEANLDPVFWSKF